MALISDVTVGDGDWFLAALSVLHQDGVVLVRGLLSGEKVEELNLELLRSYDLVCAEVGSERLVRAGESGVVRAPLNFSKEFLDLAANASALSVVEEVVGQASILHLQNGFVLEPANRQSVLSNEVFQGKWHRDFPRYTGSVPLSVNVFWPLTTFTKETGATEFLLGSHLSEAHLDRHLETCDAAVANAGAGDALIFDSTIWHRAGINTSNSARLAVNNQYTFSWIKQQMDLSRLLGDAHIDSLPDRSRQLLGYFSRVPPSYDKFYSKPEERLYRSGQG